jgi:hypothetical protein
MIQSSVAGLALFNLSSGAAEPGSHRPSREQRAMKNTPSPYRIASLIVFILLALGTTAAHAQIPKSERQVLLDLYASANGASWTFTWPVTDPPGTECSWYGITCNGNDPNNITVANIELPANHLSGSLPTSLPNLTHLQYFHVGGNVLTNSIPPLTGLTNLWYFNVQANQLTGSIPPLTSLTNLTYFYACCNQLADAIPPLTGLAHLVDFEVFSNHLTSIPPLAGLTLLGSFLAFQNSLTGTIPPLTGLTQLTNFWVHQNSLTGSIPPLIGLSNLASFRVDHNQLTGDVPLVPNPNALLPGYSSLCPNYLNATPDPAWDAATGQSPWYANCPRPSPTPTPTPSPTCDASPPPPPSPGESWSQGDPAWGFYDNITNDDGTSGTIKQYGCALVNLAMALQFACPEALGKGLTAPIPCANIDPNTLNQFMEDNLLYTRLSVPHATGNMLSPEAVILVSGGALHLDNLKANASYFGPTPEIDAELCGTAGAPHPVILQVHGVTDPNHFGHYVLATGRIGNTYRIIDPGCSQVHDLASTFSCSGAPGGMISYGNSYQIVGVVKDPPDRSELDLHIPANAALEVTDPAGRTTGFDPITSQTSNGIPQSAYFLFALQDDEEIAPVIGPTHYVQIPEPAPGTYVVVVKGLAVGSISLGVAAFDSTGQSIGRSSADGQVEPGSRATYLLSVAPGLPPSILFVPGDRNGDGVVDCSDLEIVLAAFGKSVGQPGFDPAADVNADGRVDNYDLLVFRGSIPPPTITSASATPSVLWPPNHKMVPVSLSYARGDSCPVSIGCSLTITSNEPGDGQPQWQVTDDHNLLLRAERLGNGSGRVYTITITCVDPAGNSSQKSVTVTVPHDRGQ